MENKIPHTEWRNQNYLVGAKKQNIKKTIKQNNYFQ